MVKARIISRVLGVYEQHFFNILMLKQILHCLEVYVILFIL